MKIKKVCFIVPYSPGTIPSQRFRYEQYLSILEAKGFKITLLPFFNQSDWAIVKKNRAIVSLLILIKLLFLRPFHIASAIFADFIFIKREAAPVGPPLFEWFLAKMMHKKIIYDFDDPIWLTDKKNEPFLEKLIRCRPKVRSICKWSYKISCGNHFLMRYATHFNENVILNPTTIET
jgi:hypothetical protein